MSATEAQILANRANALKSCGPKSEAGKLRSRRNALRHGMAGQGVVMLVEDEAKLRDREETWGDSFRPGSEVEDYLVGLAVHHSVKLDRCMAVESTAARVSADRAVREFAPTRQTRIATVESEIRQWDRIAETLATAGTLYRDELDRFRALLAIGRPADVDEPGDLVVLAREAATGPKPSALPSARTPSAQTPQSPPATPSPWTQGPARVSTDRADVARRVLGALIAEGRADRERERDRLVEELGSPEALAIARTLASFDIGPAATLARRYETSGELGLYRALRNLHVEQELRASKPDETETDGTETVAATPQLIEVRQPRSLEGPVQGSAGSVSADELEKPGNLDGFLNEANPGELPTPEAVADGSMDPTGAEVRTDVEPATTCQDLGEGAEASLPKLVEINPDEIATSEVAGDGWDDPAIDQMRTDFRKKVEGLGDLGIAWEDLMDGELSEEPEGSGNLGRFLNEANFAGQELPIPVGEAGPCRG